jgi:hypothetical protein
MGLMSIVLAPFAGAYVLLGIDHDGWPVEALPERVFDEGPWHSMVSTGPIVDILKQPPPLFSRDAALQDLGVTLLVKFSLDDDEGLCMVHDPLGLRLIHRELLIDEAIEVGDPLVRQGVKPYRWVLVGLSHWVFIDLHDLGVGWSRWGLAPEPRAGSALLAPAPEPWASGLLQACPGSS